MDDRRRGKNERSRLEFISDLQSRLANGALIGEMYVSRWKDDVPYVEQCISAHVDLFMGSRPSDHQLG